MANYYLTTCQQCRMTTGKQYSRKHNGLCKACAEPNAVTSDRSTYNRRGERIASADEQHARYIDCGPAAWDDRD